MSNAVKRCFKHSDLYDRLNHKPTVGIGRQIKFDDMPFQTSYLKTSYTQSSLVIFDTLDAANEIYLDLYM